MKASQFSVTEALVSVFSISLLIGAIAGQIRLDVGWSVSKYLLDWTGVFDPGLLLFAGPTSVPIFAILTVVGVYRIPVVRIFLSTASLGSVATVLAVAFNQLGGIEVWSLVPFCCFFLTAIGKGEGKVFVNASLACPCELLGKRVVRHIVSANALRLGWVNLPHLNSDSPSLADWPGRSEQRGARRCLRACDYPLVKLGTRYSRTTGAYVVVACYFAILSMQFTPCGTAFDRGAICSRRETRPPGRESVPLRVDRKTPLGDVKMTDDDESLATLATVANEVEGHLLVNLLREHGIAAAATGGFTAQFHAIASGAVRVMVKQEDLPAARAVLAEREEE